MHIKPARLLNVHKIFINGWDKLGVLQPQPSNLFAKKFNLSILFAKKFNLSILFAKKFIFLYQISKLIGFCMVVCGCLLQNSLDKPYTERFDNKKKARNAEK